MLCRICVVQVRPKKYVLLIDHADDAAPTRQHELDHIQIIQIVQVSRTISSLKDLDHGSGNRLYRSSVRVIYDFYQVYRSMWTDVVIVFVFVCFGLRNPTRMNKCLALFASATEMIEGRGWGFVLPLSTGCI